MPLASTRSVDPMLRVIISCAIFLVVLLGLLSTPLLNEDAQDAIIEQGYLYSTGIEDDPEAISQRAFQAHDGLLLTGNQQQDLWLRLRIRPQNVPLLLEVQPAYVHEVTLFQRNQQGVWTAQTGGLAHAFSNRALPVFNTNFHVAFQDASTPTIVMLRVRSPTASVAVSVLPESRFLSYDSALAIVIGLSLGLNLIMLMLCLLAWLVSNDAIWLRSVVFDLSALALSGIQFGFVSRFLLPESGELEGVQNFV